MKRTPGTRAGLSRDQILDAALAVVDRGGALTMRGLGTELGVEAMTVYHYFPTKNAVVDGLAERIFTDAAAGASRNDAAARADRNDGAAGAEWGDAVAGGDAPDGAGAARNWRGRLTAYSEALRSCLLAHPALLPMITRPAVTPATLDAVEAMLGELTAAGFPLGRALDLLNAVTVFVIGHASAEAAIGEPGAPAGLDPSRHPRLVEAVRTGAGTDDHQRFRYAVNALLTGAEQLAERSV